MFAFCLGISLLSFQNCGPDEKDCKVICENINSAPQELLDYYVFNKGSYWVYQLNGTDTLDTLSFGGMTREFFQINAGCNYGIRPCEMRYSVGFNHSNLTKFPPGNLKNNSSYEGYFIGYSSNRNQWDVSHVSGSGGSGSFNFFLAYPFVIDQSFDGERFLKDTIESVNVPGGNFICVTSSRLRYSNQPYRIQSMSFSKHIGIVKYEVAINQTWELINYHLE